MVPVVLAFTLHVTFLQSVGLAPTTPCQAGLYYFELHCILIGEDSADHHNVLSLPRYLSHLAINPVTVPNRILSIIMETGPGQVTHYFLGLESLSEINSSLIYSRNPTKRFIRDPRAKTARICVRASYEDLKQFCCLVLSEIRQ